MTIDERLERLTERHEALTMTVERLEHVVETLAASQQRAEKRFNRFEAVVLRLGADSRNACASWKSTQIKKAAQTTHVTGTKTAEC